MWDIPGCFSRTIVGKKTLLKRYTYSFVLKMCFCFFSAPRSHLPPLSPSCLIKSLLCHHSIHFTFVHVSSSLPIYDIVSILPLLLELLIPSIISQSEACFNSVDPGSHKNGFQLAPREIKTWKGAHCFKHNVTVWDGSSNVKWYAATSFTLKLFEPLMTTPPEFLLKRTENITVDSDYLFFNVSWLRTHPSARLKISC